MDLRKASFEILEKELKPFVELAIERHPSVIDIRVKRGNVKTAHDYARRVLIKARKSGFGKYTSEQITSLKPRLRVYFCKEGIAIAGLKQKIKVSAHWDKYKLPFDVMPAEDQRWTALAVMPSPEEIAQLAKMVATGIFESPVEVRTKHTLPMIKKYAGQHAVALHIFNTGRNIMLWPKRTEES